MSDLKKELIRLGSTNPELRPHIRKVLAARFPSDVQDLQLQYPSVSTPAWKALETAEKAYAKYLKEVQRAERMNPSLKVHLQNAHAVMDTLVTLGHRWVHTEQSLYVDKLKTAAKKPSYASQAMWDRYQIYLANTNDKFPKTFDEWMGS